MQHLTAVSWIPPLILPDRKLYGIVGSNEVENTMKLRTRFITLPIQQHHILQSCDCFRSSFKPTYCKIKIAKSSAIPMFLTSLLAELQPHKTSFLDVPDFVILTGTNPSFPHSINEASSRGVCARICSRRPRLL